MSSLVKELIKDHVQIVDGEKRIVIRIRTKS
jgi:hypothetical protein